MGNREETAIEGKRKKLVRRGGKKSTMCVLCFRCRGPAPLHSPPLPGRIFAPLPLRRPTYLPKGAANS